MGCRLFSSVRWIKAAIKRWYDHCSGDAKENQPNIDFFSDECDGDSCELTSTTYIDLLTQNNSLHSSHHWGQDFSDTKDFGLTLVIDFLLMSILSTQSPEPPSDPLSMNNAEKRQSNQDDEVPQETMAVCETSPSFMATMLNNVELTEREAIGRGAYGTVYRAILVVKNAEGKPEKQYRVAAKSAQIEKSSCETQEDYKKRKGRAKECLRIELTFLIICQSELIVQVIGATIDHHQFIVMEILPHQYPPFVSKIPGKECLNFSQRLQALTDAARALLFIFQRGYLIRDLKATNVMLTSHLTIKLIDGGLAVEQGRCHPWNKRPTYFAPEVETAPFDELTEVYSWGLLALQSLTGETGANFDKWIEECKQDDPDFELCEYLYPQLESETDVHCQIARTELLPIVVSCHSTNRKDRLPLSPLIEQLSIIQSHMP